MLLRNMWRLFGAVGWRLSTHSQHPSPRLSPLWRSEKGKTCFPAQRCLLGSFSTSPHKYTNTHLSRRRLRYGERFPKWFWFARQPVWEPIFPPNSIINEELSLPIYFFISLFILVWIHRLFYSVGYNTLLWLLLMFTLSQHWPLGAPSHWLLSLLTHPQYSWRSSLLSGAIRCSRLNLHCPCLSLGTTHFSKDSWTF